MSHWQLYYHVVWATKGREPMILADLESALYSCLRGKAIEMGVMIHALGGTTDHVHAVLSIPPRVAVATCIGQLKGASSRWVNSRSGRSARFEWQAGYGVFSFSERSLPSVVGYTLGQRHRHDTGRLSAAMECTEVLDYGSDLPEDEGNLLGVIGIGPQGLGSSSPALERRAAQKE